MQVAYLNPLHNAWCRMKKALFAPFDIHKWLVVGFTAFLAGLTQGPMGWTPSAGRPARIPKAPDIEYFRRTFLDWLSEHAVFALLILAALILLIILILVLTWLSSRGAFMFLDNVVHDRARVADPWHRYGALGDSLFLFRLGFGIVLLLFAIPLLALSFSVYVRFLHAAYLPGGPLLIAAIACAWLFLLLVAAYVSLWARDFVVPLMYKYDLKATAAWQKFLPLLSRHFLHFVLYGFFLLILVLGVGVVILISGCLTCCVGFVFLALPYINFVLLLPVAFTYRAFSLEFLSQWGSEFSVFPTTPISANDTSLPPPGPEPGRS